MALKPVGQLKGGPCDGQLVELVSENENDAPETHSVTTDDGRVVVYRRHERHVGVSNWYVYKFES